MFVSRPLRILLAVCVLLAVACGDTDGAGEAGEAGLAVLPASFDLAAGGENRFMVGILTVEGEPVGGGQAQLAFSRLDEEGGAQQVATAPADFLAVPGKAPDGELTQPQVLDGGVAGVYETRVALEQPGTWEVEATVDVDGRGELSGSAAFAVAAEHQVPDVGEPAPAVRNHTLDAHGDAPLTAVDSRASGDDVPDPDLHDATVAETLAAGRPAVVLVTTPVYCVSRFCGPITDEVAALEEHYGDRAEFIHLEVWRDFEAGVLNEAAAEWIQTPGGGNEPWVFMVGPDGMIQARWDNVLDLDELEDMLEQLPAA